jgi:ribonucleotide reductase beta subunit family protein with ferritin-like domain
MSTEINFYDQDLTNRFVLFPIKNDDVWQLYKKAVASFWTAEEIDLASDLADWNRMTPDERKFISYVLGFFAASDGIVNENLILNFMKDIPIPEARCFLGFQIAIENIHSEVYSLLIDTYIKNPDEKLHLLQSIQTIPCIAAKSNWALKWCNQNNALLKQRLFAFICVEGLFFSASFCSIFWLKKRNLLPGLSFANEVISRDEGLHCTFSMLLYNKLPEKLSYAEALEILTDAVEIEKLFIDDALDVSIIGMNNELMFQYIQYIADFILKSLFYPPYYNVQNPFDWMTTISLQGKTNFFEKRVSEYSLSKIGDNTTQGKLEFDSDDF